MKLVQSAARLARLYPLAAAGVALILGLLAWKAVTGVAEWRAQRRYEKERAKIVAQQEPLRQEAAQARTDAAAQSALSNERTGEINALLKQAQDLAARLRAAELAAQRAGTAPTAPDYRADAGELLRLCVRAKQLGIACDEGRLAVRDR